MSRTSPVSDLRGAGRLVADLTVLVTDVVETMHHNIARHPGPLGRATLAPTRGITGFVYRSVRGVTRVVARATDAVLAPLAPLVSESAGWPGRDAIVGALNGVLGDHLESSANPLAIGMHLRFAGAALPLERDAIATRVTRPRRRVVVMVHGLCMTDASWNRDGHDHGRCLGRDLAATTLYLRYNSGRHISTNGGDLARLLERLVEEWPVRVRELILVGHSMGGLVIHGACLTATEAGHTWIGRLRAAVFLGTPHRGAPLERGGHGMNMVFEASPYTIAFARLGRLRSAGITDLRHGSVHDEDWKGRDRFAGGAGRPRSRALPPGVRALQIAASLSPGIPASGRKPRGDGLVPVASALGLADGRAGAVSNSAMADGIRTRESRGAGPPCTSSTVYGTGHLDLLGSPEVYGQLKGWLRAWR